MLEEQFSTSRLVQGIEGKVTAELFDAKTGNLVQREETHNFIAKPAIDFLHQAQRTVFKRGIYTLNSSLMQDYQLLDKSNSHIVLTDLADAEDPENETHFYGRPIGWASRTVYSGADTLRGTVNVSLSGATPEQCTWVFDWPTNAATGVIYSVGWAKGSHNTAAAYMQPSFVSSENGTYYQQYGSASSVVNRYGAYQYRALCKGPDDTYFGAAYSPDYTIYSLDSTMQRVGSFTICSAGITNNTYYKYANGLAWDDENQKLWILGTNGKVASFSSNGSMIGSPITLPSVADVFKYKGIAWDGQYLWVGDNNSTSTTASSSVGKLWQINPADGSVVSSFTIPVTPYSSNSSSYMTDISYDPEHSLLWIRIGSQYTSASNNQILAFTLSGQPAALSVMLVAWDVQQGSSEGYIYPSYGSFAQSTNTGTYDSYPSAASLTYVGSDSTTHGGMEYTGDNKFVCSSTSNSGCIVVLKANGLGSRALLSSPISKTNSQTLRITYRVNFS